jgi:acyl-CoA synthetase (AMP-forming)/AMP-acid ligase II
MANLGRLLAEKFAGFGGKPALADQGSALSYRELTEAANAVEEVLRSAGLSADEPVMVPVANEPRDAAALIGTWLAGGAAVPIARHAPANAIEPCKGQRAHDSP